MRNTRWIPLVLIGIAGVVVAVVVFSQMNGEPSRRPAPAKVAQRPPTPVQPPADDTRRSGGDVAEPTGPGVRASPVPAGDAGGSGTGQVTAPSVPTTPPVPTQPRPDVPPLASGPGVAPPSAQPPAARRPADRPPAAPGPDQPPADEPFVPLPLARSALMMVGADSEAEAVWYEAINDPALSRNARKDLIEDLNEEGFEDPKRLTEDDVPLILRRLAIIEELAPEAMDEVNAAAFEEAYKDLVKMLEKATSM